MRGLLSFGLSSDLTGPSVDEGHKSVTKEEEDNEGGEQINH